MAHDRVLAPGRVEHRKYNGDETKQYNMHYRYLHFTKNSVEKICVYFFLRFYFRTRAWY